MVIKNLAGDLLKVESISDYELWVSNNITEDVDYFNFYIAVNALPPLKLFTVMVRFVDHGLDWRNSDGIIREEPTRWQKFWFDAHLRRDFLQEVDRTKWRKFRDYWTENYSVFKEDLFKYIRKRLNNRDDLYVKYLLSDFVDIHGQYEKVIDNIF